MRSLFLSKNMEWMPVLIGVLDLQTSYALEKI